MGSKPQAAQKPQSGGSWGGGEEPGEGACRSIGLGIEEISRGPVREDSGTQARTCNCGKR